MPEVLSIHANGTLYENFTYAEFYRSIEKASGEFFFKASNTARQPFPIAKGDSCEIYIDQKKQMSGFVNSIGGAYDAESHELRVRGRDKIQDVIDSSIKTPIDFQKSSDVLTLFKRVFSMLGITDISVSIASGLSIRRFSQSELISAEIGENAFDFLEKHTRMRQLLITSDPDGNIILTRAGTSTYSTLLKSENDGENNNIIRADFEDNDANRFHEYIVISQANPLAQLFPDSATSQKGKSAIDNNIRTSRVLVINTSLSSDIQTNTDRGKWEANIRRTKGFQYNCRMRGFYLDKQQSILIEPNNMIQVKDDVFGINSELLIKSCRYVKSLEGTYTDLELVNRDAFTLQEQQKAVEARFNPKNNVLAGLGL